MKILIIAFFIILTISSQARETVPGTKVSLIPPDDFVKTNQFLGYMMESTGSSIMVTTVPGPFPEVSQGFTKQGLATQSMTLIKKESITVGGSDAILIHASQPANGTKYLKWLLVLGNQKETVLVVATFPSQFENQLSESLRSSVVSTIWDANSKVDFFSGLTFRVNEFADLKIANKMGNNLILTRNGAFPQEEKGDPFVFAGSAISESWQVPGDLLAFTKNRFLQTKVLSDGEISEEKKVKIDDLDGYLVSGTGKDNDTGEEIFVKPCLLFTNDGYYIFQGIVREKDREQYDSVFIKVFESFERI